MIESAYIIIRFKQDDSWLDSSPKHYGSEKVLFFDRRLSTVATVESIPIYQTSCITFEMFFSFDRLGDAYEASLLDG